MHHRISDVVNGYSMNPCVEWSSHVEFRYQVYRITNNGLIDLVWPLEQSWLSYGWAALA
jgi:hypothetical protein